MGAKSPWVKLEAIFDAVFTDTLPALLP